MQFYQLIHWFNERSDDHKRNMPMIGSGQLLKKDYLMGHLMGPTCHMGFFEDGHRSPSISRHFLHPCKDPRETMFDSLSHPKELFGLFDHHNEERKTK